VFNITGYFLGDENYTSSSQTWYATVLDVLSPSWHDLGQNATWVGVNKTILLFANWSDNFDLDYAWLETNETGEWKNYTAVDINLTEGQTWSNFTWRNSSVPAGWTIGWRIFANDTSGNENATNVMAFTVNASEMWRFLTGGMIYSSSAIGDVDDDGEINVVFGSYDKQVYAIVGRNGTKVWNFSTTGMISSSPALADLTGGDFLAVTVGSYDFNIYALNGSDGSKIWNFSTGGRVYSSPAVGDVNKDGFLDVVFGSSDGKVYALNGSNGNLIWVYSTGGNVASSPAIFNITQDDYPIVFIGSYDFNMYALNGSDGSKIWNFSAQDKIDSSPAVDDINGDGFFEVVFGSYDKRVYVLNATNGQEIWNYSTGSWVTSSPVIASIDSNKKIIISSHDSNVYAFNPDGTVFWNFTVPTAGRVPYLPSVADVNIDGINDVVVGSTDGRIYAINGSDGSLVWSYTIGTYIYSSPALADINGDGNLDMTFGSWDKNEYALDPPVWPSFGANERRTRILDISPPEVLLHGIEKENAGIKVYYLWREKFSNLDHAIIEENSTGSLSAHEIRLKGMTDWVNYTFYHTASYRITVFDEYGNSAEVENFVEVEKDEEAPKWYAENNYEFEYSKGRIYEISVKWTDDKKVEQVLIEHNFTHQLINKTLPGNGIYSYVVADLPAGTYAWKSYAVDSSGNWNSTTTFILQVKRKQPTLEISVPPEVVYPSFVFTECKLIEGENPAVMIRDGSRIGTGKLVTDASVLNAGIWSYSCIHEESQNYSYAEVTGQVEVKKGIPILALQVAYDALACPSTVSINAYENNEGDGDVVYNLYNTSALIASGSSISLLEVLKAGKHYFLYNSTGGENWTSAYISRIIEINDTDGPEKILSGKKFNSRGMQIYSLWRENCSSLDFAIVKENAVGEIREHRVNVKGYIDWANYTVPKEELESPSGSICFGSICIKRIYFSIEAFDKYKNSNRIVDSATYIFFKPRQLQLFGRYV
jgi:outer membrane protein assembly factor BamB